VRVVDERESAELNSRYRGKKGATNVLSFPAESPAPPKATAVDLLPFGDVVICAAVVEREARAQGKLLAAHWAHMIVHGALHLQGYDHEKPRDAAAMEARERTLLAKLGFPDPYSIK
jgi:probable rRNA maturation factor